MPSKPAVATKPKSALQCPRCKSDTLSPNIDADLECHLCGHVVYQQTVPSQVPDAPLPAIELSPRRRLALSLLAAGLSNRQIAHEMGVVLMTVKQHLAGARDALGIDTREELQAYARTLRGVGR